MGRETINPRVDRRRFLLAVSALAGGSLLSGSVAAFDKSASGADLTWSSTLSDEQIKIISVIADIIIPETETPGAVGAGVPAFVDRAISAWLLREETVNFLEGLNQFLKQNPLFLTSKASEQEALVRSLDSRLSNLPENLLFYRQLKELVLIGYYTSETGAAVELSYDPVPGGYIPFTTDETVKAWAT